MKTVMIFGTFDILHYGHIHLFEEAKKLGDRLVAVVARDSNVEMIKGKKSFHTEKERQAFLQHIDLIDEVRLGDMKDVYKVIKDVQPNVIALGYDQKVFVDDIEKRCAAYDLAVDIVRMKPYEQEHYKTTNIKRYLDQVV